MYVCHIFTVSHGSNLNDKVSDEEFVQVSHFNMANGISCHVGILSNVSQISEAA